MTRKLGIAFGIVALAALLVVGVNRRGESQAGAPTIVLGMYAPTVEFGGTTASLSYLQGLARAISANTGAKVDAKVFSNYNDFKKQSDIGVLDGQCYAAGRRVGTLLANGQIDGKTSQMWALFSSVGPSMQGLRGKKLAYVRTGCNDEAFLEHAMLESEVDLGYFSGKVGKADVNGAVAEVASYKGAQAVFAPVAANKGLTKVFDTGSVPGPAFVKVSNKVSGGLEDKVKAAVVGYGGRGAISGWTGADESPYRSLSGRMQRRVKRGIFATPDVVRLDDDDVIIPPSSLDDTSLTEVKQHFQEPPKRQE